MKLGKDVLLEIVALVQEGLVTGTDISEKMREIEVDVYGEAVVVLSQDYKKKNGRE